MTVAKIDAKVTALRLKLDKLELSRSRVWKLDDSGLIGSSETARRLEEISQRKLELQSLLVAELEERKLAEKTVRLERETEQLCLEAWDRFRGASVPGQIAIAREVSSSLGGLRVRTSDALITGRGKDSPPYERALNPADRKRRRRGYAGRYLPRFELSPEQYAREWEIIDRDP